MNELNLYQLIITLQLPSQHLFLAQKLTQHNQICHHFLPSLKYKIYITNTQPFATLLSKIIS